jgi:hypothetical protein
MPTEFEREQALLQQLRSSGDPTALREADHLATLYHDREMDALAQDAYLAAKGEGKPPEGWVRLSEHPGLVAEYAERLHTYSAELRRTLHPDNSGFRAEIYLPGIAMQQAGYKPTLAIKGSSGEVMTSDGKRHDTTVEDFAANNFPQSVGLETDYYDRAMRLGYELKQNDVDFESTGHSLSGGMAAAVAVVTGTRATTFNAAGLNPATTARFARQHPDVVASTDRNQLITNYQVQGELLSDGVQNNLHNMDALRRRELAGVLKEVGDVLQRVPEARGLFARRLGEDLPPEAQGTVNAFVDKLATGDVNSMLHELPLAAGSQRVLAAMTRDVQGSLVPRVQVTSLPEDMRLATPLLESLAVVAAGARLGERNGEVVAASGHLTAQGLLATGSGIDGIAENIGASVRAGTRAEGAVLQSGEHVLGAMLAKARTAQAEMSAWGHRGLGQAQHLAAELDAGLLRGVGHLLPGNVQQRLQAEAERLQQRGLDARQQGMASAVAYRQSGQRDAMVIRGITQAAEEITSRGAEAFGAVKHDVISSVGHQASAALDSVAQEIENTSRHAPAVFATLGAVTAAEFAIAEELTPLNIPRLDRAAEAGSHMVRDGSEAFERHLMESTVTPSMKAHVQSSERLAEQLLQRIANERSAQGLDGTKASDRPAPAPMRVGTQITASNESAYLRNDPRHPDNPGNRLFHDLKERLPEASDNRLLQFAAICHVHKINDHNLSKVFFDQQAGTVGFASVGLLPRIASVDVKEPSPLPAQSIREIEQFDRLQAQLDVNMHSPAQATQIESQAPMLGGR